MFVCREQGQMPAAQLENDDFAGGGPVQTSAPESWMLMSTKRY